MFIECVSAQVVSRWANTQILLLERKIQIALHRIYCCRLSCGLMTYLLALAAMKRIVFGVTQAQSRFVGFVLKFAMSRGIRMYE